MTTVVSGRPFTGQPLACNAHPWAVHNGECIQCLRDANDRISMKCVTAEMLANELAAELTYLTRASTGSRIGEQDYARAKAALARFRKVMP